MKYTSVMDPTLEQKLKDLEVKIDALYRGSEKMRKYFLAVLVISVVAFVLPLMGLIFVVPQFLSIYSGVSNF